MAPRWRAVAMPEAGWMSIPMGFPYAFGWRLGATSIAVNSEQVNELVDLIIAAHVPAVAIKPYIRQAAQGLPNPNEFIAAVEAELARRR